MSVILKLEQVCKSYFIGDKPIDILRDINMEIEPGEFVSIMGPSGSGKSTLLHIMGALDRPSAGKIMIDQKDLSKMDDRALAFARNKSIGFVFQNFFLLPYYSAFQNVCLPLVYAGKLKKEENHARDLLIQMGLEKRLHHYPNTLSGGEKQRVAIARALVNHPQIIFADEPTGSLDTHNGETIMQLLNQINESGTTIVLITHDARIAQNAHRTLYIQDGQLQ